VDLLPNKAGVVVTIPGCGHAPALNVPDQIALVRRFLNGRDQGE